MSTHVVIRGFAAADRPVLAQLYWQAFQGKLGRVLGPEDKALDFIGRVASADHALCVRDGEDGALLGVAGFHTATGALVGGSFRDLAATYGMFGALWRGTSLELLERELQLGELMVDGIFVAEGARGRGIGTALIEALSREAVQRGCSRVRLEVIDANPRARALYERQGFVEVDRRAHWLVRALFGVGQVATLVRQVRP